MSGPRIGRNRPITKSLPKGTLLETLVNYLLQRNDEDDWKQNSDPRIRSLGVCSIIEREPRVWMLPKTFFVEEILLPLVERLEGPEAAKKLSSIPGILDHYAELLREKVKRDAPARDRLPPTPDIEAYVVAVVMTVLYSDRQAGDTPNSQYVRTAKLLGVERSAVRRIDKRCRQGDARTAAERKEALVAIICATKRLIWSLPEFVEARNKSRTEMFVAQRSVSSGFEHVAAQSSGQ